MTDRMTISVPDEVGAYLRRTGNASAAVTDLVAKQIEQEATADLLRRAGYDVTPEFVEEGVQISRDMPPVPPELAAQAAEHHRIRIEEARRRRFSHSKTEGGAGAA
jgi:hypothetical protein